MELTSVQRRTVEELLDVGDGRAFPPGVEPELRQLIEDGIEHCRPPPDAPLVLWKERLNQLARCEGLFHADLAGERPPFAHSPASAAGTLAHRAIEVDVALAEEIEAAAVVELASSRLGRDRQFGPYWEGLDPLDRAELCMQAVRSLEQFRASFPPIRALRRALAPVTELWLEVRFGGGWVRVRGKVDLLLNPARSGRATRVLIDLKGGLARSEHPEDMRLYALLHTLRTGVPPFRVATFFLASGEWMPEDVTESSLEHAARRVVAAARSASRRAGGGRPELSPGLHCRRCPRRQVCPDAM
jgi:hypothetical protein